MTTERLRGIAAVLALAGFSVVVAMSCASTTSNRIGDSLDSSQYPPEIRDAYKVFAVRCSRCHTLARPLNARIDDPQHWVRYVQRMRLNPASGINAKNGEIILRFLLYYMEQRQKERGEQDTEGERSPRHSFTEQPLGAAGHDASDQGSGPVSGEPAANVAAATPRSRTTALEATA